MFKSHCVVGATCLREPMFVNGELNHFKIYEVFFSSSCHGDQGKVRFRIKLMF